MFHQVVDLCLDPFVFSEQPASDRAFDPQLDHITSVLRLAQRDQDIVFGPIFVAINGHSGLTFVSGKDFSISPGMVVDGYHVILEKANRFSSRQHSLFSQRVDDFEGGIVVENLVETSIAPLLLPAADDVPCIQESSEDLNRIQLSDVSKGHSDPGAELTLMGQVTHAKYIISSCRKNTECRWQIVAAIQLAGVLARAAFRLCSIMIPTWFSRCRANSDGGVTISICDRKESEGTLVPGVMQFPPSYSSRLPAHAGY